MTSAEIVKALRCISAPAGDKKEGCESCPFYAKERLDAEWAEKLGVTEWPNCDCDAVGIAAADLIERLEQEKAALIDVANPKKLCRICKNVSSCFNARYAGVLCGSCWRYSYCPCADCLSHPKFEWKGLEDEK